MVDTYQQDYIRSTHTQEEKEWIQLVGGFERMDIEVTYQYAERRQNGIVHGEEFFYLG